MAGMEQLHCIGAKHGRSASRIDELSRAPEENKSRFEDAIGDRDGKHAQETTERGGRFEGGNGGLSDLFGEAAWRHLGGASRNGALDAAAPGAAPTASAAETMNGTHCSELVDRILVSQPGADGSAEVRIRIDESWLADTEVRINRTDAGELSVEFLSDDPDSQRSLLPNLSSLRERLADRTGDSVSVRISESADADANSGDGRSRNRRSIYDESREE